MTQKLIECRKNGPEIRNQFETDASFCFKIVFNVNREDILHYCGRKIGSRSEYRAPKISQGYRKPLNPHSVMSLMIFNVRAIDVPLFFCFLFFCLYKPSMRSACNSISLSLRDCVSQTTSEWMRSSSVPCVWQWIFLKSVTWQRPSRTLGHGANLLPGVVSHMTPCSLLGELGVGWYLVQIAKCRNDCQKGGMDYGSIST